MVTVLFIMFCLYGDSNNERGREKFRAGAHFDTHTQHTQHIRTAQTRHTTKTRQHIRHTQHTQHTRHRQHTQHKTHNTRTHARNEPTKRNERTTETKRNEGTQQANKRPKRSTHNTHNKHTTHIQQTHTSHHFTDCPDMFMTNTSSRCREKNRAYKAGRHLSQTSRTFVRRSMAVGHHRTESVRCSGPNGGIHSARCFAKVRLLLLLLLLLVSHFINQLNQLQTSC